MHTKTGVLLCNDWIVKPVGLPLIRRRCQACTSDTFRTTGKFRVNANHELLDVWLLALCTQCGATTKITIVERTNVRSVRPDLLDRAHENAPTLAAELLRSGRCGSSRKAVAFRGPRSSD
jgi:hypothetical protein